MSTRFRKYISALSSAICIAGFANAILTPAFAQASATDIVSVHRGVVREGWFQQWIEVARFSDGHYEAALLDDEGTDGQLTPRFRLQTENPGKKNCRLIGIAERGLSACPTEGPIKLKSTLDVRGSVELFPVGLANSFGFQSNTPSFGGAANACRFTAIRSLDASIFGKAAGSANTLYSTLYSAAKSEPSILGQLTELRSARIQRFRTLQFTAYENQLLARFDATRPGQNLDFRMMARQAQAKQQYLDQISNSPQRIAARQKIIEIDQQFAIIYDPANISSRQAVLENARNVLLPGLTEELRQTLIAASTLPVAQFTTLESGHAELTSCSEAIGADQSYAERFSFAAIQAGRRHVQNLANALNTEFAAIQSSVQLRERLKFYQSKSWLKQVFDQEGPSAFFESASNRIAVLEKQEADKRLAMAEQEKQRQAALAAAEQTRIAAAQQQAAQRVAAIRQGQIGPSREDIQRATVRAFMLGNGAQLYAIDKLARPTGLVAGEPQIDKGEYHFVGPVSASRLRWTVGEPSCLKVTNTSYLCSYSMKTENFFDMFGNENPYPMTSYGRNAKYLITYDKGDWNIPSLAYEFMQAAKAAQRRN